MKRARKSLPMRLCGGFVIFGAAFLFIAFMAVPPAAGAPQDDLQVKTDVESVIEQDGHLDLDELRVSCRNGIVTLGGTVLSVDEKALAEDLAMQVPGVKDIDNTIQVVAPLSEDVILEKEVEDTLLENPLLDIADLYIRSRHGVITLKGIVRQEDEKKLAGRLASEIPHVVKVKNNIEVVK